MPLLSNPQALDEAWNEAVEQAGGVPIWAKLLRLYEGGAHIALGYSSWADYCQQEFKMGKTRSYQLLQAAHVINQFTIVDSPQVTPHHVPDSEAIARELVPLLSNPQALDEAWNEAVEQVGCQLCHFR